MLSTKSPNAERPSKTHTHSTRQAPLFRQLLRSKTTRAIVIGCGALLLLCLVVSFFTVPHPDPNVIEVNGRIEADETDILAATGTQVTQVLVDEGEAVKKGQLLITLDSENLEERIKGAGTMLQQASKAKVQADRQVSVVQSDINEARKKSGGFWSKVFTSPKGRAKKAEKYKREMLQAKMMSFQAHAAVSQAQSAINQGKSKISYFKLTSPIDGIVAVRSVSVGEIVGKGNVLMTLVDPKSAYMKAFVAEKDLSKFNIGSKAEVFLGGESDKPLSGKVVAIDARPSFTPQNVYFKSDRLRQSFGMKIALDDNADGQAKPGVSADAKIKIKRGTSSSD
jgi:HlyD family secretion protein